MSTPDEEEDVLPPPPPREVPSAPWAAANLGHPPRGPRGTDEPPALPVRAGEGGLVRLGRAIGGLPPVGIVVNGDVHVSVDASRHEVVAPAATSCPPAGATTIPQWGWAVGMALFGLLAVGVFFIGIALNKS